MNRLTLACRSGMTPLGPYLIRRPCCAGNSYGFTGIQRLPNRSRRKQEEQSLRVSISQGAQALLPTYRLIFTPATTVGWL
jgi:hypothetical protein